MQVDSNFVMRSERELHSGNEKFKTLDFLMIYELEQYHETCNYFSAALTWNAMRMIHKMRLQFTCQRKILRVESTFVLQIGHLLSSLLSSSPESPFII